MFASEQAKLHGQVLTNGPGDNPQTGLFKGINDLRKGDHVGAGEASRNARKRPTVADLYKRDSKVAQLAANKKFEALTLVVISMNGIWIGVDTDWNRAEDPADVLLPFKIADQFFCIYFTFEVIVRWIAFEKKTDAFKDNWFRFDSVLVSLMIFETWVMPLITLIAGGGGGGGAMGNLSILRLLRLLRLTRMARLMKSFPELMVLIKGIKAATQSVAATLVLLIIFTYVFAIIFTGQYKGIADLPGATENDEALQDYFGSMPLSMFTLIIGGTLLDDLTTLAYALLENSQIMLWALIVFILLANFTVLNMLIGILCSVATATAEGEKVNQAEATVREVLEDVFDDIDADKSGQVSENEFMEMLKNEKVMDAFEKGLEIEEQHLKSLKNVLFVSDDDSGEPVELSFTDFTDQLLQLRPNQAASVLDVSKLRKTMIKQSNILDDQLRFAQHQVQCLLTRSGEGGRVENLTPSPTSKPVPASSSSVRDNTSLTSKEPDVKLATDAEILAELRKRLPGFGELNVPQAIA
jgi:voltage-gated sodium channel